MLSFSRNQLNPRRWTEPNARRCLKRERFNDAFSPKKTRSSSSWMRKHEILLQEMFAHPGEPACLSGRTAGRCRPNPDRCQRSRRQPAEKGEGQQGCLSLTTAGALTPWARRTCCRESSTPGGHLPNTCYLLYVPRTTYHVQPTAYNRQPATSNFRPPT